MYYMTEEVLALAFSNATQAGCSTRDPREASSNKNQIQYVCGSTLHSCKVVHVIESLVNVHHDDLWFHLKFPSAWAIKRAWQGKYQCAVQVYQHQ